MRGADIDTDRILPVRFLKSINFGRAHDFVSALIQKLAQRPELAGQLLAKIINGRLELVGRGIRLDLKRRDSGAPVASIDTPVALNIKVDELTVKLQPAPSSSM